MIQYNIVIFLNILMKKKILILNTGGTISSVTTKQGYEPQLGYVENALKHIPAIHHSDMPTYDILEYKPLLDSANMTVDIWNRLAQDIHNAYAAYDGFVIFHGTDTMVYTASALSFMLEGLNKPVILTGSQIPLSEIRNDATDNIITSLWLCTHQPIREVCIYFNRKLLRGNRAQKISTQRFDAFDSVNYPELANIGTHIHVHTHRLLHPSKRAFHVQPMKTHHIITFRLFPSVDTALLAILCAQPIDALILETYGAGNAPNYDPQFIATLEKAIENHIIIINTSQCPQGGIAMDQYATGYSLANIGLISGHDMTIETIYCKLLYLLSKGYTYKTIRKYMESNIAGEISL